MATGRSAIRQWLDAPAETPSTGARARTLPMLVVGAGPAGLAAMAALKAAGVAFVGIDSHADAGGIWDPANPVSSVYDGVSTVTSRDTTHLGKPMPRDWPVFVPQALALQHLRSFAGDHGLRPSIRFRTTFHGARKGAAGGWVATMVGPDGMTFEEPVRAIVIATGSHNRNHRSVPTTLAEQAAAAGIAAVHSADYRDAAPYAGKRMLIVGIGNSATDIALKLSTVAARTMIAVRTPPWLLPAMILGRPGDRVKLSAEALHLPYWYQAFAMRAVNRLAIGDLGRWGLPRPDHGVLDRVPVTDRGIADAIRRGAVIAKPNVTRLEAGTATFADGSREPIDAVIFATGFRRHYPLLAADPATGEATSADLAFHIFHPAEPDLAFMTELVGPRSCWPIFVEQAQVVAAYFAADQRESPRAAAFDARRARPTPTFKGKVFAAGDSFHVDYPTYTRAMRDLSGWLAG